MNRIQLVNKEAHATKTWTRFTDYGFAAGKMVAALGAAEVPRSALAMPLAFIEIEGSPSLVAVLGLRPDQNVFVGPDGKWLGAYVPAVFRGYPFKLAKTGENQFSLCVDESSRLVREDSTGERFFNEDGTPAKALTDILEFLQKTQSSQEIVCRAAGSLKEHQLLEPWPLKVRDGEQEQELNGLLRVSEAALNQAAGDVLLQLRNAGALPLAYAQLLSMQNMKVVANLSQEHARYRDNQIRAQQAQPYYMKQEQDDSIDWNAIFKDQDNG